MNAYEVFNCYVGVKQHFRTDFDYFKYKGKINTNINSFIKRRDAIVFETIARKYISKNVVPYMVSNLVIDPERYIIDFERNDYINWRKRVDNLSLTYKKDLNVINEILNNNKKSFRDLFIIKGDYPAIVRLDMKGYINKETTVILSKLIRPKWLTNNDLDDIIVNNWKKHILKYCPFIPINEKKYAKITKEVLA